MKTKTLLYSFAAITVLVCVALFCASPQDPRTQPESAKIMGVAKLLDTVVYGIPYHGTVIIQLPEFVDSIIITKKSGTVFLRRAVSATDSLIEFVYEFTKTNPKFDTITVIIVRKQNAGNDTFLKPVVVIKPIHIKLLDVHHLNNCPLFDTIWADTCAYDLDSTIYPDHAASSLNWSSSDTLRGNIYRMVKIYNTFCLPIAPYTCITFWSRRWVVEYDDNLLHLCLQGGRDTLYWYAEDDSLNLDIQPLILHRP
jgi:hypothetical protein